MEMFLNQVLAGLSNGCIYACLALALVMIYQATHHINFAQGEMATVSTFGAWYLLDLGWAYWPVFLAVVALSFVAGGVIERVVIRHVDSRSPFAFIAVTIGLLMAFNALCLWLTGGGEIREFPSPFPQQLGNRFLSSHETGAFVVTVVVLLALLSILRGTRFGLALRAAAQNPVSSRYVGLKVDWMYTIGWGLSASIGAIAGMMVAPIVFLDPNMMSGILLYAFAGALLGGIDSPVGAVIGSFVIGVLENLVGVYITGSELKLTVALAIIVLVLIFRPAGLLGKESAVRV